MARPTKLSQELHARIVDAVRAGNYIETAAAYAGVNKSTLYAWLKKGARSASGPFWEFSNAIEKALASAEVRDVALIGKAADTQWQAAAWRLERKHPQRWGRQERVDLHGKLEHSGAVSNPAAALTTEQLLSLVKVNSK